MYESGQEHILAPRPSTAAPLQGLEHVPEVLAPAGGRAQFFAALNAGADAVYLGLRTFNARARAENFSPDDLRELVPLAHAYGMKVLVTMNILIKELELADVLATLATLEEIEVDAIIVQDQGLARLARTYFPALRLHASTQMAVHNLAGVQAAVALGFRRVVLARELTHQEIRRIRSALPRTDVEIEAFCHGSLCYSYSGLCFFSGAEDARSGNRGECAYTCRQPYKILNEPGHGFLFSMKDFDTSLSLELLAGAGVDTLKIEGRKKDAQYVASTVKLYRQRLDEIYGRPTLRASAPQEAQPDGTSVASTLHDLSLSFQRRPTAFFLKGRYAENVIDLDNPTHRGLEIGRIERVQGHWVSVRTQCSLERFDGLRIDTGTRAYHSKPQDGDTLRGGMNELRRRYDNERIEFSLRELRIHGKRSFTVEPGSLVDIELPKDLPVAPQAGDMLLKIRSADLKRRVDALSQPPTDTRVKVQRQIAFQATTQAGTEGLSITVTALKFGEPIETSSIVVAAQRPQKAATLKRDLNDLLQIIGDAGFSATSVQLSGDFEWFVPRSKLKTLKQKLVECLPSAYERFLAKRLSTATDQICTPLAHTPITPVRQAAPIVRRFSFKTDRIDSLLHLAQQARSINDRHRFLAQQTHDASFHRPDHDGPDDFFVEELIFEPKRAFLSDLKPEVLAQDLARAASIAAIKVRLALPTVIRAWDEPLLKRWLEAAHKAGISAYECGNIGAFELLQSWGLPRHDLASDFTLYALSSAATRQWRELGVESVCLSLEDDSRNLRAHLARLPDEERAAMQAIIFKDTPLFIAEACSLTALHDGCPTSKVCGYRTLEIENPQGERFFVAHESCKSIVYGKDAYAITHRQDQLLAMGISRFRLDFLTRFYEPSAMDACIESALKGERMPETHSANFDRTLL